MYLICTVKYRLRPLVQFLQCLLNTVIVIDKYVMISEDIIRRHHNIYYMHAMDFVIIILEKLTVDMLLK